MTKSMNRLHSPQTPSKKRTGPSPVPGSMFAPRELAGGPSDFGRVLTPAGPTGVGVLPSMSFCLQAQERCNHHNRIAGFALTSILRGVETDCGIAIRALDRPPAL